MTGLLLLFVLTILFAGIILPKIAKYDRLFAFTCAIAYIVGLAVFMGVIK